MGAINAGLRGYAGGEAVIARAAPALGDGRIAVGSDRSGTVIRGPAAARLASEFW
jgi:hypothetical protein